MRRHPPAAAARGRVRRRRDGPCGTRFALQVYLSPDADAVLDSIDDSFVFVIGLSTSRQLLPGGAAPHGSSSAYSIARAGVHGVRTARIPVRDVLPAATTSVLNINTAFEALLVRLCLAVPCNRWGAPLCRHPFAG